MILPRVIPVLLLKDSGLVKTVKFKNSQYIGDPINTVRIFNDKEVDEIIFLDISKTPERKEPNYTLIKDIADECFVPFAYGGGINSIESIKKIIQLGAEKVVLNTAAFEDKLLVTKAAELFGSQSIVVAIDVKKNWLGKKEVVVNCGKKRTGIAPLEYALEMQRLGAGELFINSIDREGTREGYDIEMFKEIALKVEIPVIASGGAGQMSDFKEVLTKASVDAVAAGSMFVYYGKRNGVLINYPDRKEIIDCFDFAQ